MPINNSTDLDNSDLTSTPARSTLRGVQDTSVADAATASEVLRPFTAPHARQFDWELKKKKRPVQTEHILQGGDSSDPIDAEVTVARYLKSKFGANEDEIFQNYEEVAKDYNLSGNPVTDASAILSGDADAQERASTVIARGLDRVGYTDRS